METVAAASANLSLVPNPDHRPASTFQLVLWLATAALAGAAMMGLELTAFRLYAPYFGYSVYVWGTMISVVMAALTAGYAIGGRLADRASAREWLYRAILASAAYQLIILYAARTLLPALAEMSIDQGEFVATTAATLLIFAPPMIALAATGPIIVRLCARSRDAGLPVGSAAGSVYAISTAGGIAGILITIFGLLPGVGTHRTLVCWCIVTFAAGAIGLVSRSYSRILILVIPVAALASPDLGWAENTTWTAESAYNLIRVVRQGTRTALLLNHRSSVHTIREESTPWTGYYYDTFALGPILTEANHALVLGMGAGGSIQAMRAVAPQVAIDAVEIDPKVVEAATRWFGIDPNDSRIRIHVADARPWVRKSRNTYDLVQLDLYQGGPYIPFYLVTEEFFRLVRAHTADRGVVMMNVFDPGVNHELLNSTAATLRRAFSTVMEVKGSGANYMLIAFASPASAEQIRNQAAMLSLEPRLRDVVNSAMSSLAEIAPPAGTLVFTDDRAPVEEITRRILAPTTRNIVAAAAITTETPGRPSIP